MLFFFDDEYFGSLVHCSVIYYVGGSIYPAMENPSTIYLPLRINKVGYCSRGRDHGVEYRICAIALDKWEERDLNKLLT